MSNEYNELRTTIHDRLLDILDLSLVDTLSKDSLKQEIRAIIEGILSQRWFQDPIEL